MYGNSGNNVLDGLTGTDNMNGGNGDDTYYCNTSGDVVNEAAGAAAGTLDTMISQSSNTIAANVERLICSTAATTTPTDATDRMTSFPETTGTTSSTAFPAMTRSGRSGNDTLTGGAGLDIFQFLTAPNTATNRDIITDYNVVDDTIQIDNLFYAAAGAAGLLAANLFKNINLVAQDADDAILYDQANGNLYYDNNGLAAGGVVHFAEVTNGLALTNLDIFVV